ncbi:hypothetical protein HN011_008799 [Eciton burchellii]|nr:hypothetical protein HN011_008799 [Eciton burchellii]
MASAASLKHDSSDWNNDGAITRYLRAGPVVCASSTLDEQSPSLIHTSTGMCTVYTSDSSFLPAMEELPEASPHDSHTNEANPERSFLHIRQCQGQSEWTPWYRPIRTRFARDIGYFSHGTSCPTSLTSSGVAYAVLYQLYQSARHDGLKPRSFTTRLSSIAG